MVKITALIAPRQCGKTTLAIYELSKSPEDTIFIASNTENARYAVKNLYASGRYGKNYLSSRGDINIIRGFNTKKIILDEYCFFDEKFKIALTRDYKYINSLEEILIFSTPKKIYKETDFNLVLESKITNIPLVNPTEDQYELLNSLLTEPNCTIIKNNSFLNKFNEEKIEEMKKYGMGDKELYGKFLE